MGGFFETPPTKYKDIMACEISDSERTTDGRMENPPHRVYVVGGGIKITKQNSVVVLQFVLVSG